MSAIQQEINETIDFTVATLIQQGKLASAQAIYDELRSYEELWTNSDLPCAKQFREQCGNAIEDILQHSYHVLC